ncbi:glycosyltransferase family 4 protein [Calditrichota bacterium GD2]
MQKNIAILHYSCPPVVGGVEEIIRQQASLFHRYHHPVKVLAGVGDYFQSGIDFYFSPLLSSQNSEIKKLQQKPVENQAQLRAIAQKIFNSLKKALQRFDVLIAHNVLSMPYNLPLTNALHQLANEKVISVVNWNHDSPFFYNNYPQELELEPFRILKTYNPNIHYVTISESRAVEFRELYQLAENDITVIPNGIDPIRFFRLDPQTVRLIQEQELFMADLIMVQPSRLHPRKNIELSIEVLHALRQKGLNAKLLVTGAYDPHERKTVRYHQKLIRLAERLNVLNSLVMVADYQFNGGGKLPASRVTMHDLYLISDVLFMPSKIEGFGIPLLEAGMIKLPIVCSDIPPFRSIAPNEAVYFDLKEEPQQIAEKIQAVVQNNRTARWFRKVMKDYVWDNIYEKDLKPFLEKIT